MNYGYPPVYKLKGLKEQVTILRQCFPDIGSVDERLAEHPLPEGAEGYFAIPRWEVLASTYGKAVEKMLAMIASRQRFHNSRDGKLGTEYLRQHAKTAQMFQKFGTEQKDCDILVLPAQFGFRHKGCSVRRAREAFLVNEFGLGALAVGAMVLTHPEREVQWNQLHIDCAGDDFAPGADGDFSSAPLFDFRFRCGGLRFAAHWSGHTYKSCGSASAFVLSPA